MSTMNSIENRTKYMPSYHLTQTYEIATQRRYDTCILSKKLPSTRLRGPVRAIFQGTRRFEQRTAIYVALLLREGPCLYGRILVNRITDKLVIFA